MLALAAAGVLPAQTTLFVTVGPYFYSFDAITGTAIAAPLGNTNSYTAQAALDGNGKIYVALWGQSNVGVYDVTSGATMNQSLIASGYSQASALGLWGGDLYVASQNVGVISRVDPSTGTILANNLITGLSSPNYMVIDSSGRMFVTEYAGRVSLFDAGTGTAINRNFISGLTGVPGGIALDNAGRLYVAFASQNKIVVYDSTTGRVLNPDLIAGLSSPRALAVDPSGALYVSSYNSSGGYYQVGRFDGTTGATLNAQLLINGGSITSLNIQAVPEPATWVCLALGFVWLGRRFRWRAVS